MADEIPRLTKAQGQQRHKELRRAQRCEASNRAKGPTGATRRPRPANPVSRSDMEP